MAAIDLSFFSGLPVAVLGLGKSGLSAARALAAGGAEVWAWDDNEGRRDEAAEQGVSIVDLLGCDWSQPTSLVLSPGIPHRFPQPHPVTEQARRHGCEIISDIELLGRAQREARYLGITGTNGKSTTTALTGHILESAGRKVAVGGNLGIPVLELEALRQNAVYVLEMSSYQLEITRSITFDVAVLLNISPDHLDRHGGMDGYIAAKRLIFNRQAGSCTAIVGVDDTYCRAIYEELTTAGDQRVVPVSSGEKVAGGVYVVDGVLTDDLDGNANAVADLRGLSRLPGRHNAQNAAAAYAACRALGVAAEAIVEGLRGYTGLPHRQEEVAAIDGVRYINDSKATNAEATARALACYDVIYWIAGGQAKEGGLSGLEIYYPRIAEAFLIGEAEAAFASVLEGHVRVSRCGTLAKAVDSAAATAARDGREGTVVLLSPACASFDQFPNFEARGDAFRDAVAAVQIGQRSDDTTALGGGAA